MAHVFPANNTIYILQSVARPNLYLRRIGDTTVRAHSDSATTWRFQSFNNQWRLAATQDNTRVLSAVPPQQGVNYAISVAATVNNSPTQIFQLGVVPGPNHNIITLAVPGGARFIGFTEDPTALNNDGAFEGVDIVTVPHGTNDVERSRYQWRLLRISLA